MALEHEGRCCNPDRASREHICGGCGPTLPHKQAAQPLLDDGDSLAGGAHVTTCRQGVTLPNYFLSLRCSLSIIVPTPTMAFLAWLRPADQAPADVKPAGAQEPLLGGGAESAAAHTHDPISSDAALLAGVDDAQSSAARDQAGSAAAAGKRRICLHVRTLFSTLSCWDHGHCHPFICCRMHDLSACRDAIQPSPQHHWHSAGLLAQPVDSLKELPSALMCLAQSTVCS
jgi:hypothetical protein